MHSQLNFPPLQIVFINTTSMYIEVESVGQWVAMKWWVTAKLRKFQGEMALNITPLHSKCHKNNIDKSMAYIMNESSGDFQQGGCLYKLSSGSNGSNGHLSTCGCLTDLRNKSQKADQSTFGSGVAIISQLIDRTISWRRKMFFAIVCMFGGFFLILCRACSR